MRRRVVRQSRGASIRVLIEHKAFEFNRVGVHAAAGPGEKGD